jgi:divalent metal cation (Fe/Co/Zn/Cd) transporter
MAESVLTRHAITRRGKKLEYFTIVWNSVEGIVAVIAGIIAGSVSLVGFGVDSFIEVTSGAALLWRMSVDAEEHNRERVEQLTLRIVGACFLALAAYVGYEALSNLMEKKRSEHSLPGIILACVSLVVMPLLSRAKRRVATHLKVAKSYSLPLETVSHIPRNGLLGRWPPNFDNVTYRGAAPLRPVY